MKQRNALEQLYLVISIIPKKLDVSSILQYSLHYDIQLCSQIDCLTHRAEGPLANRA
jgi:hypothetical protein